MIDVRSLALALDGDVAGRNTVSAPGPGHSRRDRSLTVKIDPGAPGGLVVFSHSGDDWAACKDHVRDRLGWPRWQPGDAINRRVDPSRIAAFDRSVVEAEAGPRECTADDLARIQRAGELWDAGTDPRGTIAEKYLASRALTLTDDVAGTALRFHSRCPWRDENIGQTIYIPTLIAAFRSIDDDAVTAVHRIRVDQPDRWPKTERRMLGLVHRAAVKLDPVGGALSIGEGVETALAARQFGYAPAWVLGSVGMISRFPLIEGVGHLRIMGETGEASARAVRLCGRRWHTAGRKVQVIMPSTGSDLNDELMAATA